MIIGIAAGVLVAVGLLAAHGLLVRASLPDPNLLGIQAQRHNALLSDCAMLGWTLTEDYPGMWVVRGHGLPPAGYGAESPQGIRDFLEGFIWGRAHGRAHGQAEADGTPAQR